MTRHRDPLELLGSTPAAVRELAPGFYSTVPPDTIAAPYDRHAVWYDTALRWPVYHRVAWGTSVAAYRQFGQAALEAAGTGHFAEIGCGSLLFTAPLYRAARPTTALLVDRSLSMLRRAIRRLDPSGTGVPDGVGVLHADGARVPVRSGVFSSILSLNLLHVRCDRRALAAEFRRTLVPGSGRVFVSAIVRSGRWSDAYLRLLYAAGAFAAPLAPDHLAALLAEGWGRIDTMRVEGSMAYLAVRHAG